MAVLSKDAILALAAAGLPKRYLEVPELGGTVIVQGMSGAQRDEWERSLLVGRGARRDVNTRNIRARLAVRCLVNEDGSRMFTDEEADLLGALRVDALQRIFDAAQELSGVSNGDIDELKKSSETAAGTGSPSN